MSGGHRHRRSRFVRGLRMTDVQLRAMIAGCALGIAGLAYWAWSSDHGPQSRIGVTAPANAQSAPSIPRRQELDSVDLSDAQLDAVKVEPVQEREFPVEKEAVGSVDFNEYMTSQVFTPYQGRIIALFAAIGDDVKKGQTLFTIDSPDLLQAESSLIAASGVFELTSRNLKRLQELYASRAVSQHELDQAISDHQTAEGNLKVTRDAVRIFGKSETEINQIVTQRKPRLYSGGGEPDQRAHYCAECLAGSVGAARHSTGALHRRRYRHDVDGGECRGA